ncbi:GumC family protein [Marimonas lutisalis]|uniref:GumC family protein n=1 Tax=Marimonas lutisalis TaxID=2545756 RepID=UPI0010F6ABD1|nr:chain-length determining protein [Marimonas lutisalis]
MSQIQSVGDFLNMVRRRAMLIIAVVMLGSAFSVWWTLNQPRVYEATAVAQIETPTINDPAASPTGGTTIDHRLRLLEQQLMARDNLIGLIDGFRLFSETDLSLSLKVAQLRESVRITQITDPTAAFGAQRVPTGMMISVTHPNPETAAAVANEFLSQLVSLNRERRSSVALQNLEFYQSEAQRVEAEMAALEARLAAFKEQNSAYLPAGITAQRDEMGTLRSTLLDIEQQLIELEATRTRQRAEVIERQGALLEEQRALINTRIAEIEDAIASAPEIDRQFGVLTRQLEQLQDEYSVITRRATEAEMGQVLESQQQFERIEVLESALVPENPVSGSRKKKAAMGAALSGVLGLGLAFLLEMMNPVIRTRAQLERELNVKAVVAIPNLTTPQKRRRRWLITIAVLVALVALASAGWQLIRDFAGALLQGVARRATGA